MSKQDQDAAHAFVSLDFKGDNLDPAPFLALIPLTCRRPVKKGDPLTRPREGKVPRAKTGFCNFITYDKIKDRKPDEHIRCVLEAITPRLPEIRTAMKAQDVSWRALLFEGEGEGESFSDISPELFDAARQIGLPLERNEPDAYRIVHSGHDPKG